MRAEGFNKNHSATGVEYLERFNNELLKDKDILDCIKYHHAQYLKNANIENNHIAYIVYEADNIASGIDRRQEKDIENEHVELKSKWEKFDKSLCLSSVFNKIKNETDYVYKLRDLEDASPNNPVNDEQLKAPKERYQNLKIWIDKNISGIKNPNSLLQLLEATMSFVPSSTNTTQVADISLYDHSKLTSAIAVCMYQYFEENNITDYKERCFNNNKSSMDKYREENYFRLISFDMSGIQNFIYTIASKNALKSLRARSFYLEFLMEHIQDELLEALNLSRANILYSGGGHSYLLLPNTDKTSDVLKKVQISVNDWFISNFSTELYLAYADVECSSNDLMNSQSKFKELSKKLSKSKLQRYTNEQLERIFTLDKDFDNTRECGICKKSGNLLEDIDEDKNVCEFCQSLINLGGYLVKDKNFAIVVSDEKEKYSIGLPTLSDNQKYFKIIPDKKGLIAESNKRYYAINDFSSGDYYATNIWMGDYCSFKGEGKEKEAYSFKDYAKASAGIKRLGVFRADVDNLGSTFTKGFGEYSTISRYATLSRMLNMFYKRYINSLCESKKLAIVYSGGDDVFVVGAWNDVLKFAKELREAFSKYSCKKLTLSAGVGFFTYSYPISKMAELTGKLEDFAKGNNDNSKDSIALFGENKTRKGKEIKAEQFVFTWEEFDKILELQKYIEDRCYFDENEKEDNKIFFSTALIYRLMTLINSTEEIGLARFAYTLARMEKDCQAYKEIKSKLYETYQNENERKKLLTALNLIVYKNRK
jgi:CRISPR-associated protein Csm1